MRILFIVVSVFWVTACYTQSVHFGLPSIKKKLHSGDLIIINIPNYTDGRFVQSAELDKLKEFFLLHSEVNFTLYIHIFGGSSEFCLNYSDFLSRGLNRQLGQENLIIEGKGNKVPLFQDESSSEYLSWNSRIEIVVGK